jgi:alpha-ribazole phosphatase
MTNGPFTLYLMRHGEPERAGLMLGHTDCPSTVAGITACQEQAQDLHVETLISSGLVRSHAAAGVIASNLSMPVTVDIRWREMHFGGWDGLHRADIDSDALARFIDDPENCIPPGGESWSALMDRVGDAIMDLEPRPTLVLTHAGAMRAALSFLCGFTYRQLWGFDLQYSALLCLRIWPGERPVGQVFGLWP